MGSPNLEATGENEATTKCSSRPYCCLFPPLVSFHLGSRISNPHAISCFIVSYIIVGSIRAGAVFILYSQSSAQPGTELVLNSIYMQTAFSLSLLGPVYDFMISKEHYPQAWSSGMWVSKDLECQLHPSPSGSP